MSSTPLDPDPWKFESSAYERGKYQAHARGARRPRTGSPAPSRPVARSASSPRCWRRAATTCSPSTSRRRRSSEPGAGSQAGTTCASSSARCPRSCPRGPFDLVLFSEILYYWSAELLERSLSRLAGIARAGRKPGGRPLAPAAPGSTRSSATTSTSGSRRGSRSWITRQRSLSRATASTAGTLRLVTHAAIVIVGGGPGRDSPPPAATARRAGPARSIVLAARAAAALPAPAADQGVPARRARSGGAAAGVDPGGVAANEIRVQTGARATAIDPGASDGRDRQRPSSSFDRCVLATGSQPARPELPGADDAAVHTVRTVEDSDALRRLATASAWWSSAPASSAARRPRRSRCARGGGRS